MLFGSFLLFFLIPVTHTVHMCYCTNFNVPAISINVLIGSIPDVRLVDGDGSYRGRLEIRHTGEWGTVCNKSFNYAAASVVCHQLGYTGAYQVQSFRSGPAGGVIWLENVQCNGNEASLLDCKYDGWGETSCTHDNDVGITCIGNVDF